MALHAALFVLTLSTLITTVQSQTRVKTVIIGGGMAGLSAAAALEETNREIYKDYVILEATDRIGGRIKTQMEEQDGTEYPLEIGAGWIHGTSGNPLYDIAALNNLLTPNSWSNKNSNPRFTQNGPEYRLGDSTLLPESTWRPVKQVDISADDTMDEFYAKGLPSEYTENSSLEDYILNQFYKSFNGTVDDTEWRKRRAVMEVLLTSGCWSNGCHSMDEVSLKNIGAFQTIAGGNVPLPRGYKTVVDVIRRNVPESKIKLNHAVNNIDYYRPGDNPTVIVSCTNEESYEADHVIVTSSLGYLKDNARNIFHPTLPTDKNGAIERMGWGTVDKIYLEFDNLDFITNTDTGVIYFARDPEELKFTPSWWHKVFICYVEDVPKANMLTCWLTGLQAEEMERQTDNEVASKLQFVLQEFLGVTVPTPTKIIRSMWKSEQYVKGSYSFIRVGSTVEDIFTLARPISWIVDGYRKPILMFAGEATHLTYFSSTHGAYLSGRREAATIANYYRDGVNIIYGTGTGSGGPAYLMSCICICLFFALSQMARF